MKPNTVYFDEDVANNLSNIPKNFKSKFINQVLRDYFLNNSKIEIKIEFPMKDKQVVKDEASNTSSPEIGIKNVIDTKSEDMF